MKFIRYVFTITLPLLWMVIGGAEVLAMNTGFSTELLSVEDMNTVLQNVNISLLADEPPKKPIECFAVNEDGVIAVGCSSSENKTVCLYTSDGVFQYGYSFKCSGNFGIELDQHVLSIYLVRSDVIISLDSDGSILDAKSVQDTIDNNEYRNLLLYSTTRKVGNTAYLIRNDMGIFNWIASSFSQIVTIDATGTESIIYDVNSIQFTRMIVTTSLICVFVLVAIAVVVWQFIKLRHGN